MAVVQVPPPVGTSGQFIDAVVITSSTLRQIQVIGSPVSSSIFPPVTTAGLGVVSASSGLVQISGGLSSGIVTLSSVHTVTATAGTNPWSSAPGFNVPMVSASSGLVQISGNVGVSSGVVTLSSVHSVTATAATNPWSSAPGFNVPVVNASSGLVQISGNVGISSGVVTLSSVHTVTATAGTNPWSSAPGFNVPVVNASSGLVQISGNVGISSGVVTLSSVHTVTATAATNPWSSAPSFNVPIVSASSGLVQISGLVVVASSGGTVPVSIPSTDATSIYTYVSSSSANSNNVQSGNTALYGYAVFNTTGTIRYVHLYHTSSAPTVGTTAQYLMALPVPGSTAGGGGANLVTPKPLSYSTRGLGFTITDGPSSTSTGVSQAAADMIVNLIYSA